MAYDLSAFTFCADAWSYPGDPDEDCEIRIRFGDDAPKFCAGSGSRAESIAIYHSAVYVAECLSLPIAVPGWIDYAENDYPEFADLEEQVGNAIDDVLEQSVIYPED